MECISCQRPVSTHNAKIFRKMLLCPGCAALGEKAERELVSRLEAAKAQALNWLDDYIMRGGLNSGGSGEAVRTLLSQAPVPVLRDPEKGGDGAVPLPPGVRPTRSGAG